MSVISQSSHVYAFDETVGEVSFQEFWEMSREAIGLYNMQVSTSPRERIASHGSVSHYELKAEGAAASTDRFEQQFRKTFTHSAYAKVLEITREAQDDDAVGLARNMGVQLGKGGADTEEYYATELFNDLFDGATFTAEDDKSICNDAHTNAQSGNSQDNSGSLALNYENVKTTRRLHRNITGYESTQKLSINPSELVAGIQLEEDVWQIVRTAGKPGTANNDMNMFRGWVGYILPRVNWTTKWAIMDPRLRREYLKWFMRVGLEIQADATFSQGNRKIGGYLRFSNGCTDWRWVYGNSP